MDKVEIAGSEEFKQKITLQTGHIVIVSGVPGGGKDYITGLFSNHHHIQKAFPLQRIVTYADRAPRPGEQDGIDYHFVGKKEFDQMIQRQQFAEVVPTGLSRKGTHKDDLLVVLEKEVQRNVIWRIDPERAADVGAGTFFPKLFGIEKGCELNRRSIVFWLDAEDEVLLERARRREGDTFDEKDFVLKLAQHRTHYNANPDAFHVKIKNQERTPEEIVEEMITHLSAHFNFGW